MDDRDLRCDLVEVGRRLYARGLIGGNEGNISVRQGLNYMRDPAGRLGTMWYCPSDPAPGPMQQHSLVRFGEVEELTHLDRRPTFDVAKHEHPALVFR